MTSLLVEQLFHGLQSGVSLFLLAAGLTLILGSMNVVYLAHGSQLMVGAYAAAFFIGWSGQFWLGVGLAVLVCIALGAMLEYVLVRHLYARDHMEQVLVSFGIILMANEIVRILFGSAALYLPLPPSLSSFIYILPNLPYPLYRLLVIGVGVAVAIGLYVLLAHTKLGARIRAATDNSVMTASLGVRVAWLRRIIFALGAGLAGLAGILLAPLTAVAPAMGEPLLIQSLVVIIIGGIGSVTGAFIASILVGVVDTLGRVMLPDALRFFFEGAVADAAGPALASMLIYIVMAAVLVWKPTGLMAKRS